MDAQDIESPVASVLSLTAVLLLTLWYFRSRRPAHPLPPGPRGLPFIGVAPALVGKNQFKVFTEWAREYGDVVSFIVFGRRFVVINDFNLVRETFRKEQFAGRPRDFILQYISSGRGIVFTDGPLWKEQRRFGLSVLRDFGMGKIKAEQGILVELKHLIQAIEEKNGEAFDPQPVIHMAVCNVIGFILFGKRYSYDDPHILRLVSLITESFRLVGSLRVTVSMAPWLRHLPGDMFGFWKLVEIHETLTSYFEEEINSHKSTYHPDITRDFVDAYLHRMEQEKSNDQSTFTDKQLSRIGFELFAAGVETTTTALCWTLVYLLNNPHIQPKLQADIGREVGSGMQPSMKHRVNLPNVEAMISETFRYSSLTPGAVPHSNPEEEMLNGYRIPKRSMIIPNVPKIEFDPILWKEPMKFSPERFLDQDGHVIKPDTLLPFSIGKRSCLGESLAIMELFLFFTGLLQAFSFLPETEGKLPSIEPVNGSVFAPQKFLIRAERRI